MKLRRSVYTLLALALSVCSLSVPGGVVRHTITSPPETQYNINLVADGSNMTTEITLNTMGRLMGSLGDVNSETLSMTLTNGYQAELTMLGLSKISKAPEFARLYRVFCLDDDAYRICKDQLEPQVCSRTKQTFANASDFRERQFDQIGMLKLRLALELLGHVREVAIYDGDVAHFRFSQRLDDDSDFMYQQENQKNTNDINIGQLLLRDTSEVKGLLQRVLQEPSGWDQKLINKFSTMVHDSKRKPLPPSQYASQCWPFPHNPVTFHANCMTGETTKLERMKNVFTMMGV